VIRECEKLQSELDRLKAEKVSNTECRQAVSGDLRKINEEICKQVNCKLIHINLDNTLETMLLSELYNALLTVLLVLKAVVCLPRVGSGVVRILLHFLTICHKRRLNQVLSVLYFSMVFILLFFIRTPFYVLLVFVSMRSVFWLFWLSCQCLPSDWLERLSE